MSDAEKALAAADALIVEHALEVSEYCRHVIALAYALGQRDGIMETAALADASFERLAADLRAVTA